MLKIQLHAFVLVLAEAVLPAQVTFTEYQVPTPSSNGAESITAGPDGSLWFTEHDANKIGRITPARAITEFPVPTSSSSLQDIAVGSDGNLWFTDYAGQTIWRMTTTGVTTGFASGGYSFGITAGPDGNLWFAEGFGHQIGRITPAGVIMEFPIPTSGNFPYGITGGPDGNAWFTELGGNNVAIGRITPSGVITEFPVPTASSGPAQITTGPDGNLWFVEEGANNIAKITTGGVVTEFPIPTAASTPLAITSGPDSNLWFTEHSANKIGKAQIGPLYNVCLLYDPTKAVKSGSTMPIKLELCDGSGNDLSSSSITVHAIRVTQTSSSISGVVQDSGNANPDSDFRFDSTFGTTGGYIFNLKTTGLLTGTYSLNFTVTGDSFVYSAPFQVK